MNGMGGISSAGIKMALDSEPWITDVDRSGYIRKLITYLTTSIETQQKDTTLDGKKDTDRPTSKG